MFEDPASGALLLDEWDLVEPGPAPLTEPTALHAAELAAHLPGADLAHLLDRGSIRDAADDAVLEAVLAWQRMAAWAAAGAARAAAELADRPSMNPTWPRSAGTVAELNVAGEELAMALMCSRMSARTLVRDGRAFTGVLAATGDALARGEIDLRRARVLVQALEHVPVPLALDVQDAVLPSAPGRTAAQLGQDVARALIVADPAGAQGRHVVAARGRRLDRPRALPDGMAGMWAVLPAADAARLDSGIDALARSARSVGDPRTLDQLRADVLVELTTGGFATTVRGEDPAAGLAAAPGVCGSGVCASGPDASGPGGSGPGLAPALAVGADRSAGVHSGDPEARPGRRSGRRSEIRVTVPLSSLLGLTDEPGELAGHGPITAETARALARDGTWRRLVTDPLSGAVLDVGRTSYRPPEALAEHVRVRDRRCARPGCGAVAESCDLDHTVEYGRASGRTSADNLGPLCPRDHAVKTDGGFRLTQVAPGVFEWTTPVGRTYRVTPGSSRPVERRLPPDEPPPF